MFVSLIISVYKDVTSLRTILEALRFQSYTDFEIIVSEDGESVEMRSFLQGYQHPRPIIHQTQPDVGWRKNEVLNKSIQKSRGTYLVFIDGDCVPHHKFIENHVKFSGQNVVVAGRRVKLGPKFTELFKSRIQDLHELERACVIRFMEMKRDKAKFYEEGIYVEPTGLLGRLLSRRKFRTIKGCNMSFYKSTIVAINGFDEDYQLPAIGEDIDLIWRFQGLGFTFVSVKNFAVQYHLHHKENWTDNTFNEGVMMEKMARREFICKNGIQKL